MFPCKYCGSDFLRDHLIKSGTHPNGQQRYSCRPCDHAKRTKFSIKERARYMVQNAVADGRLEKPDQCEFGCRAHRIDGHHDDYSKPLDVRWLCPKHHAQLHLARPRYRPLTSEKAAERGRRSIAARRALLGKDGFRQFMRAMRAKQDAA